MNFLESYPFFSKNAIREFYENKQGAIRKRWGQNFLINPGILDKIVKNLDAEESSQVLEIGSGLGALTRHLILNKLKVTGIEIDPISCSVLESGFDRVKDNVLILNLDALEFMDKLQEEGKYIVRKDANNKDLEHHQIINLNDFKYICGNLPYYISTKLLEKITLFASLKRGCFLLQKEYANKISASGSASSLSVYLKNFGEWKTAGSVRAENFFPKPRIDSAILGFKAFENGPKTDVHTLEKLLRMSFATRRKKLRNSWKQDKRGYFDYNLLMEQAKITGMDTELRAEQLPEDAFFQFADLLFSSNQ